MPPFLEFSHPKTSPSTGLTLMDALFLGLSVLLFLVAVGLAVASHHLAEGGL